LAVARGSLGLRRLLLQRLLLGRLLSGRLLVLVFARLLLIAFAGETVLRVAL
jgi:hypothetical protein